MKKKILSQAKLQRLIPRIRSKKKIVFTNGVFDLLHVGHLKVFETCKKKGDVLIVGLNTDASTRRLKGPKRPLNPQKDRALMLAGLESIDYVVLFGEDTPHNLIRKIRPHVLIKGGDYKKGQIVGREFSKKVVRVPLQKGRSSTGLVERILKRYGRKR